MGEHRASPPGSTPRRPATIARAATRSLEISEWNGATTTSRDAAMAVPTIAACRNLVVGSIVQMHPFRHRGGVRLDPGLLLTQPDPATTWQATIAGTIDDLLFHGFAYWRVLATDGSTVSEQNPVGFPVRARWIPFGDVTPDVESTGGSYGRLRGYRIAGEPDVVPVEEVIRFDAPIPGVLVRGADTIAAAASLEDAARRLSSVELPAGVLENQGAELNPDEAADVVESFQAARRSNAIAFVQGVTYKREQLAPADLQLVEARSHISTECARLFNVPVAMVGASPSGGASAMLYANLAAQLALLVSTACSPFLVAIEQTLSLPSVTPRGTGVSFDVQAFLRSDPQAAADYAIALHAAGLVDRDEARAFLGIPPSTSIDLTPGRVTL